MALQHNTRFTSMATPMMFMTLLGTLAVPHSTSWANSLDLHGAGSKASSLAGAMTATTQGYTSLYYNPAAMVLGDTQVGFGISMSENRTVIRLKDRPPGYDLPNLGMNSPRIPSSYRLHPRADSTDTLSTRGFLVGAVSPFGIPRLHVGVLAYLPFNRLGMQRTHFSDEREQYFTNRLHFDLIGARSQHQHISVGLAYRVATWISIGLGLSFLPGVDGTTHSYLDNPTDQSQMDIAFNHEQKGRIAPLAGLLIQPTETLRLGMGFRGENYFTMNTTNIIQVRGFQDQEDAYPITQRIESTLHYSPHQISVGVGHVGGDLQIGADLVMALWSRYINHHNEAPHGFSNTLSGRLGMEKTYSQSLVARLGLAFEPTPVPEQTGRSNYVDNDRLVAAVGASHTLALLKHPVSVSWHIQVHHLIPRDTDKALPSEAGYVACAPGVRMICDEIPDDLRDSVTGETRAEYQGLQTGNPGFPGFLSYGQIFAFGVDLSWMF